MKKDILKSIKSKHITLLVFLLIPALIFNGALLFIFYAYITGAQDFASCIVVLILIGPLTWLVDSAIMNSIKIIENPLEDSVFKKYGTVKDVEKILNEIESHIEYEDENIIISKRYIYDKRDINGLVRCNDVLNIYKLVSKLNYIVNGYSVVIVDKYDYKITYNYSAGQEKTVNKILLLLSNKCPNAVLGYSNEADEYVSKNKSKLIDKKEDLNTTKKLKKNSASGEDKYEELVKIKKLFDDGVLTKKEFENEKQKILNSK